MAIDFVAGICLAALAGMGVGGGGLLVIYLTLFLEMEQRTSQGVNLLFFIFAAGFSLLIHIRKRNIKLPLVLLCSISGICFAMFGANVSSLVDGEVLRRGFGVMLILAGSINLIKTFLVKKKYKKIR
ncbi:MAG: sulfite exporter TauE/SafE family protein [Clostridia bacterium]|nr:sulfite exporter TauE/SafE family protein [Clostridia bacterium]